MDGAFATEAPEEESRDGVEIKPVVSGSPLTIAWFALCLAGSSACATLALIVQLRLGLPLAFVPSLLAAALIGFALPALFTVFAGSRLTKRGVQPVHAWFLTTILLMVLILFSFLL